MCMKWKDGKKMDMILATNMDAWRQRLDVRSTNSPLTHNLNRKRPKKLDTKPTRKVTTCRVKSTPKIHTLTHLKQKWRRRNVQPGTKISKKMYLLLTKFSRSTITKLPDPLNTKTAQSRRRLNLQLMPKKSFSTSSLVRRPSGGGAKSTPSEMALNWKALAAVLSTTRAISDYDQNHP